jgi:hypothetical protein
MSGSSKIRIAAVWLYVVAAATLLNSLILQLFSRFVDLLAGLWFTQAIDAMFFGMRSVEPQGSPPTFEILLALIADVLVVLVVVILAVKLSRGSRRAAVNSLFLYAVDTGIFVFSFGESVRTRVEPVFLLWQGLTVLVHVGGTVMLYCAWNSLRLKS